MGHSCERIEADANDGYLWPRRESVLYRVQLSTLYHRKRERFLAFLDRAVSAIAIVGGSAAFANLGGPGYAKLAAAVIALTSTIGLVFGLGERARRHSELARQFLDLEAQMILAGERDFSEADVNRWDATVRAIEASEPPTLGALVVQCQNELARVREQPDKIVVLNWRQRLLMHFVDFRSFPPA